MLGAKGLLFWDADFGRGGPMGAAREFSKDPSCGDSTKHSSSDALVTDGTNVPLPNLNGRDGKLSPADLVEMAVVVRPLVRTRLGRSRVGRRFL